MNKYNNIAKEDNIELGTEAYPNYQDYLHVPGQRDTHKWLQAIKDIYYKEKNGIDRISAIKQITSNWNVMETKDFLNWLRFYEEGAHLKYKTAQLWYENGSPGYFLHIKQDPPKTEVPEVSGRDVDLVHDASANEMSLSEKKQIIERQRNKIIGRLDSTEKLLRSQEGQLFAGKELESLIEALYQLKKKVQLMNKLSTSFKIYDDMIIREGNILNKNGFVKAANLLYSLADDPSLAPPPPNPPNQGSGSAGGLPSMGPGMPQTPPESAPSNPPGIDKFLENLDTAKITTKEDKDDVDDAEDNLEVNDTDELMVEAQAAPTDLPPDLAPPADTKPLTKKPVTKAPAEEPLEVKENDTPAEGSTFDKKIDAVLSNLTVGDVVSELEDIAKIFKTREIPRRLAIADMMLDSLGLATYFPALSEAQNKSLEANNYISSRIEDIISKLRGAVATKDIDLKGENAVEKPEVAAIKNKLQQDADKEKARKQMRKEQEAQELETPAKETPEIEVAEDLKEAPPVTPAPVPAAKPPTL